MPDNDFYLERALEAALSTHKANREDLITFYKALGQVNDKKIPEGLLAKEKASEELAEAEKVLAAQIKDAAGRAPDLEGPELNLVVGRFALSLFLVERTKKLREIVLKQGNLALYSLYSSLRGQVCEMLGEGYYSKSLQDVLRDYVDIEPLLIACSELCGLAVPPLQEIVKEYTGRVADEVGRSV